MGGCEGTCCMFTCYKSLPHARIFGETAYPDQDGELEQPVVAAGLDWLRERSLCQKMLVLRVASLYVRVDSPRFEG